MTTKKKTPVRLEIVYRDIDSIKPYANNPRKNDDAVADVASSIEDYDFNVPINIDADGVIITGHTRYKAAKALGIKEVPTVTLAHLSPRKVREYRIRDNKVGEKADWDYEILEIECQDMGIDPSELGFDCGTGLAQFDESETEREREDLSDRVRSAYEVIIECSNELEQEATFNKLQEDGYKCRVLTL